MEMEAGGEYSQYLLSDPLAHQFPELQDAGIWAAEAGTLTNNDLLDLIPGDDHLDRWFAEDSLDDDSFGTSNQLAAESSPVQVDANPAGMYDVLHAMLAAASSLGQSPVVGSYHPSQASSLEQGPVVGADHPSSASLEQSPVLGTDQPSQASSLEQSPVVGADQPSPAPADATIHRVEFESLTDLLTTPEPDHEREDGVAEMVRVAARCGEDDAARTVWSEEEHKELLDRLHLHAGDDAVTRCFKIAFHLPRKTALDVALRCRWLQDKSKTSGKAELAPVDSFLVKGTKVARSSNKIYPLSEEALNSKSTRELLEDNIIFLKRIEENLRTGQRANTADYFYYVKTNMDAIEKRGSEFGISLDMPPIDEQGLEEIMRARLSSEMDVEKLKRMAGAVRTGGKGSMRRKKKAVHKTTTTDDKRLQSTLKRIGVNTIPGIEEVNIFKDDVVIQFQNPKVQASIPANTWVVSGVPQTKSLQDMLPTIINQLGPDNLDNLRRIAEQFQKQSPGVEGGTSGAVQDDDDDVPDLVPGETFEEAAEEKKVPEPEEKKE